MKTNLKIVALALLLGVSVKVSAQVAAQAPAQPQINQADRDELIYLTPSWKAAAKDKKIKLPVAKAQVDEIIAANEVANVH